MYIVQPTAIEKLGVFQCDFSCGYFFQFQFQFFNYFHFRYCYC